MPHFNSDTTVVDFGQSGEVRDLQRYLSKPNPFQQTPMATAVPITTQNAFSQPASSGNFVPNQVPTNSLRNNPFAASSNTHNSNQQAILNMLAQQASNPGSPWSALNHMIKMEIFPDGRIIPGEGNGVVHMYVKDFRPQKTEKLEGLDNNLWKDFSASVSPIGAQMRKQMRFIALAAFATLSILGILPIIMTKSVNMDFVLIIFVPAILIMTCLSSSRSPILKYVILRRLRFVERVQRICDEFAPRFRSENYNIEFFDVKMLIVFAPSEIALENRA